LTSQLEYLQKNFKTKKADLEKKAKDDKKELNENGMTTSLDKLARLQDSAVYNSDSAITLRDCDAQW
jgi:hypothetical protein